jgi:hypothetical protein
MEFVRHKIKDLIWKLEGKHSVCFERANYKYNTLPDASVKAV